MVPRNLPKSVRTFRHFEIPVWFLSLRGANGPPKRLKKVKQSLFCTFANPIQLSGMDANADEGEAE
jgi:hypothetical protein